MTTTPEQLGSSMPRQRCWSQCSVRPAARRLAVYVSSLPADLVLEIEATIRVRR